jgi:DNA-directed RNA polymerase II subunit RPB2
MASVHGQKGVVGMILSPENMPYNKDGIVPDIIVNPHAFPSRMTIGHLFECILAKTCVYKGMMLDATPFNNNNYDSIYSELETEFGLEKYGNEIMYNGRTGEQIHTEIFFGPTYYQRLKHMVSDKINYRTTGPVTITTRQPTKGRGNNGGLRIGEMERDSVLSHGMSAFLKESLMERSDNYMFDIENSTGEIAVTNKKTMYFKPYDDNDNFYTTIKAPYSLKLLLQEIKAMGVKPILSTSCIEEEDYYEDIEDVDISESEL